MLVIEIFFLRYCSTHTHTNTFAFHGFMTAACPLMMFYRRGMFSSRKSDCAPLSPSRTHTHTHNVHLIPSPVHHDVSVLSAIVSRVVVVVVPSTHIDTHVRALTASSLDCSIQYCCCCCSNKLMIITRPCYFVVESCVHIYIFVAPHPLISFSTYQPYSLQASPPPYQYSHQCSS